ncbi:MAG: [FeFe] hydrogenase, group A, partial [Bacteroidota bacterium]
VEGRGLQPSCSIKPEEGMKIKTHTGELREMRKITLELLLANHEQNCATCTKSSSCKLKELANKLGVEKVRFKKTEKDYPLDLSSASIQRDPNKCILCGDCVRACYEIQDIGAIDFAFRGSSVKVTPASDKELNMVDCVDCGQCARVCPTAAISVKTEIEEVWDKIDDPQKTVVAQIAPAVRVAIGEMFGLEPGKVRTGQIVSALKMIGFDRVYDTSFAADLTVVEEANEFLKRYESGEKLPLMTSCCPAWVKYVEQYYPEYLGNVSSCKSPQQMFGAVAKDMLPEQLKKDKKDIVVVSIVPCTAKKAEAKRPEFAKGGIKEVDHVITTQELAYMIREAGIRFKELTPESMDMPLGYKTGAGVIFGSTGGVSEAVLRYLNDKNDVRSEQHDYPQVRGNKSKKILEWKFNGKDVRIAIVNGLKNAKELLNEMKKGKSQYDFIEVMACPGGCVGGAGQPQQYDHDVRNERAEGLYNADKMLLLHESQKNTYVNSLYKERLGEIGGEAAHELLHTHYKNRKRIAEQAMTFITGEAESRLDISVCLGTNCYLKGAHTLLQKITDYVEGSNFKNLIDIKANFCMENCDKGVSVTIGDEIVSNCTIEKAIAIINKQIHNIKSQIH